MYNTSRKAVLIFSQRMWLWIVLVLSLFAILGRASACASSSCRTTSAKHVRSNIVLCCVLSFSLNPGRKTSFEPFSESKKFMLNLYPCHRIPLSACQKKGDVEISSLRILTYRCRHCKRQAKVGEMTAGAMLGACNRSGCEIRRAQHTFHIHSSVNPKTSAYHTSKD
jgi:hypothetical protein